MMKRCGCDYGACFCPSPPEKTLKEKMNIAVSNVIAEYNLGVEKLERQSKNKEEELLIKINNLKTIIRLHKVTDVKVLKEENKSLKSDINELKKEYDETNKSLKILLEFNPKLKKMFYEMELFEFKKFAKKHFNQLYKKSEK